MPSKSTNYLSFFYDAAALHVIINLMENSEQVQQLQSAIAQLKADLKVHRSGVETLVFHYKTEMKLRGKLSQVPC